MNGLMCLLTEDPSVVCIFIYQCFHMQQDYVLVLRVSELKISPRITSRYMCHSLCGTNFSARLYYRIDW